MAVTIFHKTINRIRIINNTPEKPETKMINVKGRVKSTRHTITEIKDYD